MSNIRPIRSLEELAERKAAYKVRTGFGGETLDGGANWGAGLDAEGLLILGCDLHRRRLERKLADDVGLDEAAERRLGFPLPRSAKARRLIQERLAAVSA